VAPVFPERALCLKYSLIPCIRPGGRGPNDPPIYGWTIKG